MYYWKILHLLALIVPSIQNVVSSSSSSSNSSSAGSSLVCAAADSFSRLAEFFARNSRGLDVDGYFGVSIAFLVFDSAPASSVAMNSSRVANLCGNASATELRRSVSKLRQVLDEFRARVTGKAGNGAQGYDLETYLGICRPLESVMSRLLSQSRFRWQQLGEGASYEESARDANEALAWLESVRSRVLTYDAGGDACFKQILTSSNSSNSAACRPSPACKQLFLSSKLDTGYALTHQLMYWFAAMDRSCHLRLSVGRPVDESLAAQACRRALTEHRNILALYSASVTLVDLALEQALICGCLGYRDFFSDSTMLLMHRLLDGKLGCIREDVDTAAKSEPAAASTGRKLMGTEILDGVCSSHTSGLAVAFFSLYLRK